MTLAYLSAAVLAGTAMSLGWGSDAIPGWRPPIGALFLWSAAAVAVAWVARSRTVPMLLALTALALVLGLWRGDVDRSPQAPPDGIDPGAQVTIEGGLLTDPKPFGSLLRLPVRADTLVLDEGPVPVDFTVDVLADRLADTGASSRSVFEFRYGDRYRVTGRFDSDPTVDRIGFVRRPEVVLLGEQEGNAMRRSLARFRSSLAASIRSAMPEPVAGLAAAVTVADRTGLPDDVRDTFRASGTAHLLAISGLHVGIIAVSAFAFSAWALGRRRQLYLIVPLVVVWGYALLAGMSEPVTRAAVMATVYLAARALGRQRSILPALALAAALMVLIEPGALGSAGFQLSFAAVAGIAMLGPPLVRRGEELVDRWLYNAGPVWWIGRRVIAAVAISVAATVATVPLVAVHFDAIPVWGVLATLATLPAMPFLVGFAALAAVAGLAVPVLGQVIAWPAWGAGTYVIETVRIFSKLPPGPIDAAGWSPALLWGYYGALIFALARRRIMRVAESAISGLGQALGRARRAYPPRRPAPRWLIGLSIVAAAVSIAAATTAPDSKLTVTFFETDRGDMILIETPGGRQALIDGGENPDGAVRALGKRLPFWDRSLDLVVLTHPHADHVGGLLKVLERYEVDLVLDAPVEYETGIYDSWLDAAGSSAKRRPIAVPGQWIALDQDVLLEVITAGPAAWSSDVNDASVVLRLHYRDVSFLLTGDMTSATEAWLMERGSDVSATVLKVAHQGSRGSSSQKFLEAVSPALSVIPVGARNQFGHPHAETLERLAAAAPGAHGIVTADRGDVTVTTDGARVWMRTER